MAGVFIGDSSACRTQHHENFSGMGSGPGSVQTGPQCCAVTSLPADRQHISLLDSSIEAADISQGSVCTQEPQLVM